MALLTLSKESELHDAGNSALTSSVLHRLERNLRLKCACLNHITRNSSLTQLAQIFIDCPYKQRVLIEAQIYVVSIAIKLGPDRTS